MVELSPEEHQGLETLVRRYSTPQQLARRGRIILSAAAGLNNSQIAREVGLDVDTVRFWRNRWLGLSAAMLEDLSLEERLRDAPRPGAPARITPEQVCQIMSLACEAPSQKGAGMFEQAKGSLVRTDWRHGERAWDRTGLHCSCQSPSRSGSDGRRLLGPKPVFPSGS